MNPNFKYLSVLALIITFGFQPKFSNSQNIKESDANFDKSSADAQLAIGVQDAVVAYLFFKTIKKTPSPIVVSEADKIIKARYAAEFEYKRAAQLMQSQSIIMDNLRKVALETSEVVKKGNSVDELSKSFTQMGKTAEKGVSLLKHSLMTSEMLAEKGAILKDFNNKLNAIIRNGGSNSIQSAETLLASTLRRLFNFVKVTGGVIYVGNFASRVYTYNYLDENPSFHPVGTWAWRNVLAPTGEYVKDSIVVQLEEIDKEDVLEKIKEWIPSTDWQEVNADEVPENNEEDYMRMYQGN